MRFLDGKRGRTPPSLIVSLKAGTTPSLSGDHAELNDPIFGQRVFGE